MKIIVKQMLTAFIALMSICASSAVHACSVCMGANDSQIAPAINGAIFLMLGFVGFMMISVLGFIFYLAKRANSPMPPHEELAQAIASMEGQTT